MHFILGPLDDGFSHPSSKQIKHDILVNWIGRRDLEGNPPVGPK